jgi:hypothetical protein
LIFSSVDLLLVVVLLLLLLLLLLVLVVTFWSKDSRIGQRRTKSTKKYAIIAYHFA